jgi:uncharacterized membrane protein required for colicin V production
MGGIIADIVGALTAIFVAYLFYRHNVELVQK